MHDSVGKTVTVAFLLCVVCSILVSSAAVILRPAQEKNKILDMKRNILSAAGMLQKDLSVDEQFSRVETIVIDYSTGEKVGIDPENFDQKQAAKSPEGQRKIPAQKEAH